MVEQKKQEQIMAYNGDNKLKRDYNILKIVERHYIDGVTTYAGILREYVAPVYPMDYKTFMKIVNDPESGKLLRLGPEAFLQERGVGSGERKVKSGEWKAESGERGRQVSLLEVPGVV